MDKEVKNVFKAKLIKVVDGDTLDARIDLGFDVFVEKRIRLWGINAPETRSRDKEEKTKGYHAKCRLIEILDLSEGEFHLVVHGEGKFGRCLAEIYI